MKHFLLVIVSLIISVSAVAQDFIITKDCKPTIYIDTQQEATKPVVGSALEMLQGDMKQVLNASLTKVKKPKKADIICSFDSSLPREGFNIYTKAGKLYIEGADAHGLAYGMLEVSRLMGVSPWVYFADCTPKSLNEFRLKEGFTKKESPAVAYRGIFINDEDWGMNPWATKQEPEAFSPSTLNPQPSSLNPQPSTTKRLKGAVGPKVNEKIFQLLLRLRANYYWPAMHECTQPFYLTKGNREMAAKYGIYMGGSHCEPMACSAATEWAIRGKGNYNYVNNRDEVKKFWQDRLDSVKNQEVVYTIGMRGVHDGSMEGVKTPADKLKYLQMVIDDQREMLRNTVNKDVASIPQVFVPYKEVLEVYRSGLKVPDDVTLMWTDDNYGYIRHFPDSVEAARKGGNGIYYHISYWGKPHDYIWLSTISPYLLYQQMTEGYNRGIRKMWILNVGDIKPGEYLTEEFLDLAWYGPNDPLTSNYSREFGAELAPAITDIMDEFYDLANDRKPEHMAGTRIEEKDKAYWNKIHPIAEWTKSDVEKRVQRYQKLSDDVEAIWAKIPADKRDAFFELVKYPVQASVQMNFKYLVPERCTEAYDSIQALTYTYNKEIANGKWDTMMPSKPRYQHVFDEIAPSELPTYNDSIVRKEIALPGIDPWSEVHGTHTFTFTLNPAPLTPQGGISDDPLTPQGGISDSNETIKNSPLGGWGVEVRLLPSYPVGKDYRLAFSIQVDDEAPQTAEYQTYDREEEWKQNVLRNYAVRTFRFPIDLSRDKHTIRFTPLTDGVILKKIFFLIHNS